MTIELSKTQTEALQSGAAHDAGHITLPATLRGGARQKVLTSLVTAKLAGYRSGTLVITPEGVAALGNRDTTIESRADSELPASESAEPSDDASESGDSQIPATAPEEQIIALTSAGDTAPSAEADYPPATAPLEAEQQTADPASMIEPTEVAATESSQSARHPRTNTKQARLIEMLRRPEGATIDEVVKALDWQAHTVRGAMAGALKKKLGLEIESDKEGERGRVYRIAR
jgi:hypothetical protein